MAPTGPNTARMSSTKRRHEVRFPLDPLWASPAIDAIGIDYYAPLADWRDSASAARSRADRQIHTARTISPAISPAAKLTTGSMPTMPRAMRRRARRSPTGSASRGCSGRRTSGISGRSRITSASAAPSLAAPTAWVPQSKPIWLTEIGCPAVDKGANQPSVFPDPKSSESALPYFSNGDARRPDPAPIPRSRARRLRSGIRRRLRSIRFRRSMAAAWSPPTASICGPGTRGRIRRSRRRATCGATRPTGRPAIG